MTTLRPTYSTNNVITITSAATLANAAAAGCVGIINTANLFLDAIVTIKPTITSSATGYDKVIYIWFAASEDGITYNSGNTTLDNYSGVDAAVTLQNPTIFRGPFTIPVPTTGLAANSVVISSVTRMFGSLMLPPAWGIIVENRTGQAFTSFAAYYTGINYTSS